MQLAVARRNEGLDSIRDNANTGFLRLYNGTPPANPDAALSGNTLLAELVMNAAAFGASSSGVITANAITQDSSANASGTVTFARVYESNGTTVWSQINDVGTTGTGHELELSTLSITSGQPVSATSFTVTWPYGT
jgi:hypothetical protein